MSTASIVHEITRAAETLNPEQQQRVLAYIHRLGNSRAEVKPSAELLALAGTLPHEDAAEMLKAVEEGCGQINTNAW